MAIGTPHNHETNNPGVDTEGVARNYDKTTLEQAKEYFGDLDRLKADRDAGNITPEKYKQIIDIYGSFNADAAKVGKDHPEHIAKANPLRSLVNKFLHRTGSEVTPQTETAEKFDDNRRKSRRGFLIKAGAVAAGAAVVGGATVFGVQQMNQPRTATPPVASDTPFPPTPSEAPTPSETPSSPETPTGSELPAFDTEIKTKTHKETQAFDFALLDAKVTQDPKTVWKLWTMGLMKAINIRDKDERDAALATLYYDGRVDEGITKVGDDLQGWYEQEKQFPQEGRTEDMLQDTWTYEYFADADNATTNYEDKGVFVISGEWWAGLYPEEDSAKYPAYKEWVHEPSSELMKFIQEEYTDPETGETSERWVIDPSTS